VARRKTQPIQYGEPMPEEAWGERVNRAYRLFRAKHGLVYEDVANRLNDVGIETSQPVIADLADFTGPPSRSGSRLLAFWVLLAYGRDPREWGLDETTVPLGPFDVADMADKLNPNTWAAAARIARAERVAAAKRQRAKART
jgi:hypothetical protein